MANKYVHNNPRDPAEERFERLETQVTNIEINMNLLIVALEIKIEPFIDNGGSNLDIISEGKSGDREDSRKESWK